MKIANNRLFVSTVAEDARETALQYGLGLEIAEFCTAMNMDTDFPQWDARVRAKIDGIPAVTFHAPFNELCPSAIEPLVVEIAHRRYRQAAKLAFETYGVTRMVVHSGYVPLVYFKSYFQERSVEFWRSVLEDIPPEMTLMLENVMEDEPNLLTDIVKTIDNPRFKLCFDIGHANTIVSNTPMSEWIDTVAPHIGHVHLHNNFREWDDHNPPDNGLIDMLPAFTRLTDAIPSDATIAIESIESAPAAKWLHDNGFIA